MGTNLVERGITRYDIDEQGTYGFMVRISRSGNQYNQFFSDKKHKGKRKALDAARKQLRKLKRDLPPPQTTKGVKTARNQSGIVGVHLAVCESIYGEEYSSYCASWKVPQGARKKLSFSFKKYGKQAAWKLACLARELESTNREKIEQLYTEKTGKRLKKKAAAGTSSSGSKKKTGGKKKVNQKKVVKKKGVKKKAIANKTAPKKAKRKVATRGVATKKTTAKKAARKKSGSKKPTGKSRPKR